MKLIYLWVNNYKNIFVQEGIQISPEVLVKTKVLPVQDTKSHTLSLSVTITDNRKNVINGFYGKNVTSVTAMVGKNGSGKTTLSHMLLDYIPSILVHNNQIKRMLDKNQELFFDEAASNWDARALYLFFDESDHSFSGLKAE